MWNSSDSRKAEVSNCGDSAGDTDDHMYIFLTFGMGCCTLRSSFTCSTRRQQKSPWLCGNFSDLPVALVAWLKLCRRFNRPTTLHVLLAKSVYVFQSLLHWIYPVKWEVDVFHEKLDKVRAHQKISLILLSKQIHHRVYKTRWRSLFKIPWTHSTWSLKRFLYDNLQYRPSTNAKVSQIVC